MLKVGMKLLQVMVIPIIIQQLDKVKSGGNLKTKSLLSPCFLGFR